MTYAAQSIPEILIYEMVDGSPVYYKDYKDYLKGRKPIEAIMGSGKIQALIIAELIFLLRSFYGDEYLIFTNELGIQFSKNSWRAADIAVVKSKLVEELDNKYLTIPPEIVIEIDTKAELKEVKNPLGYYQEKTQELLQFGVKKVFWIFTETGKIMIAHPSKQWSIVDWDQSIEITSGLVVNLKTILDRKK